MESGPQFDEYHRSDKGFGRIPSTTFAAYREPTARNERGVALPGHEGKGAFLELDHPRSESYYYYNEPAGSLTMPGHQQQLFAHTYRPPTVSGLGAQEGMEHHVPSLLGMAAQESLQRWGRLPEASGDLSQHSRPMVQHLVNRGVIDEPKVLHKENNPYKKGDRATEAWAFENSIYAKMDGERVPDEQAAAGSAFTRSLLRSQRRNPTASHRQLEFDLGGH